MSKHRCPWCGEKTLTTFQKSSRRTHDFALGKVKNKVYFSCPSCNNEVEHRMTIKGKKYESVLIICILILIILHFIFITLNFKILLLLSLGLLIICGISLAYIYAKFTEFVKHGKDN